MACHAAPLHYFGVQLATQLRADNELMMRHRDVFSVHIGKGSTCGSTSQEHITATLQRCLRAAAEDNLRTQDAVRNRTSLTKRKAAGVSCVPLTLTVDVDVDVDLQQRVVSPSTCSKMFAWRRLSALLPGSNTGGAVTRSAGFAAKARAKRRHQVEVLTASIRGFGIHIKHLRSCCIHSSALFLQFSPLESFNSPCSDVCRQTYFLSARLCQRSMTECCHQTHKSVLLLKRST